MRYLISCFLSALLLISMHTGAQSINTGSVTSGLITLTNIPSIPFVGKNVRVTEEHKQLLAHIATVIKDNPDYYFSLTGYCTGKYQIQQSALRINSIVRYLVDKEGISPRRFEKKDDARVGDCQTIDFRAIKQE